MFWYTLAIYYSGNVEHLGAFSKGDYIGRSPGTSFNPMGNPWTRRRFERKSSNSTGHCPLSCVVYRILTGWWLTYPSEKWWSSSVGIILPNIWKVIKKCLNPPNRCHYFIEPSLCCSFLRQHFGILAATNLHVEQPATSAVFREIPMSFWSKAPQLPTPGSPGQPDLAGLLGVEQVANVNGARLRVVHAALLPLPSWPGAQGAATSGAALLGRWIGWLLTRRRRPGVLPMGKPQKWPEKRQFYGHLGSWLSWQKWWGMSKIISYG